MKEIKKIFYMIVGILFILLGIAGVLLPIIPGLPFLIMGIIFIARASKKFMKLVFLNKYIGKYIKKFRKMGIDVRVRNFTLGTIWVSHLSAIIFIKIIIVKITMGFLLVIMNWMLFTIKTYRKNEIAV